MPVHTHTHLLSNNVDGQMSKRTEDVTTAASYNSQDTNSATNISRFGDLVKWTLADVCLLVMPETLLNYLFVR